MATSTVVIVVLPLFDEAKLAVAGFLARYSGPTRVSYACDLRQMVHLVPPKPSSTLRRSPRSPRT
ncbi:MAG: hypothetical protein QOK39_2247, partial [Acidimicrobiaceae bacterium]|nr:hypothetical protein [Acidimicrobiaceae bacterium]